MAKVQTHEEYAAEIAAALAAQESPAPKPKPRGKKVEAVEEPVPDSE